MKPKLKPKYKIVAKVAAKQIEFIVFAEERKQVFAKAEEKLKSLGINLNSVKRMSIKSV